VTLQALDPIFIDFFVPQQQLELIRIGQSIGVKVDAFPNATNFTGRITTIDPEGRSGRPGTSPCAQRCQTGTASCCRACTQRR
jgi:multidrug resistance efflux pump